MKRFIFFILLALILESCEQRQKEIETLPDYVINVSKEQICEEKMPLHILFDSVEVVFPDRQDSVLLGTIEGIRYNGKDYYVFDDFYQLFQFNSKGHLVQNFTKIGRGPYEYIYLKDVYYDYRRQQMMLLVAPYYKLIYINSSGKYIREVDLPFRGNGYECIASVKDSVLFLGSCFNKENTHWGTMGYFYQDSLTPYRILRQRDFNGTYPAYYWAVGELEDESLVIGYTHTYDTLCMISPQGTVTKQVLKLQIDDPYITYYRYVYDGLMMLCADVDKGDLYYGYPLLHDRLSGKSKMWNSRDFGLIGNFLCSDRENMYFVYSPINSVYLDRVKLQELGYGSVLQKLDSLHLTEEDNPVILRYHLKTSDELRKVLNE